MENRNLKFWIERLKETIKYFNKCLFIFYILIGTNLNSEPLKNDQIDENFPNYYQIKITPSDFHSKNLEEMANLAIYSYDFDKIDKLEQQAKTIDRKIFLKNIFNEAIKRFSNSNEISHQDKWYAVLEYFFYNMKFSYPLQPIYRNKTLVTDPVILLLLGEGRCGHIARVIVDIALANGYEARLVQLAAHIIAEVKWENKWHFIDAISHCPVQKLMETFKVWPSISALAKNPYILDTIPCLLRRADNYYRTLNGQYIPFNCWYPGILRRSSMYFAEELFYNGVYFKENAPREGIIYYYKNGLFVDWQNDKYFGWQNLSFEIEEVPMIPIDYDFILPKLAIPQSIYEQNNKTILPIRFTPAYRITSNQNDIFDIKTNSDDFLYEVRISSQSRGWDYDFPNYQKMPNYNKGDLGIYINEVKYFDDRILGFDLELENITGIVYVEVIAKHKKINVIDKVFAWPSEESIISVHSDKFVPL